MDIFDEPITLINLLADMIKINDDTLKRVHCDGKQCHYYGRGRH